MADKLTQCKACGETISSKAKSCPKCGAPNKKPIYKRGWFIALVAIVLIGIIVGATSGGNSSTDSSESKTQTESKSQEKSYTPVTTDDLVAALKDNALNASDTYKGMDVELTGKLSVIDSSGEYISLKAMYDEFSFTSIHCSLKSGDDAQRTAVGQMTNDCTVVLRGTITDVGEVLGYSLDIDEILSIN